MAASRKGAVSKAMQRMWAYDLIKCYGEGSKAKPM